MPHLTLEYSANVPDRPDLPALLGRLHEAIQPFGPFNLADCKSRAYRAESFRVGAGGPDHAFVHLTIAVLDKRDEALRARVGEAALEVLAAAYPRALSELVCDVTVEVRGIRTPNYFKRASGADRRPPGATVPGQARNPSDAGPIGRSAPGP
jgi:5-carboxymethyl-2-hydroxymuconate isomerase